MNQNNIIKHLDLTVYTDGSCIGNPGKGGWASLIEFNDNSIMLSSFCANTTNNRMEMQAVIEALRFIITNPNNLSWLKFDTTNSTAPVVILVTDSNYLKKGMQLWVKKWQANNWQTADRKPVKNQDLWRELIDKSSSLSINWQWVKGHSGQRQNEKVDKEARKMALSQRS